MLIEARLQYILLMLAALTLIGGTVLWLIEGPETFETPFNAIWWALVTMTAVGYGDYAPLAVSGRLVAMFVMLAGVMTVGVLTARISSVLVAAKIREGQGLQEIDYHEHLIIAGWFPGAEKIIETLGALRESEIRIALLNDLEPGDAAGLLERFSEMSPKFVRGDLTQTAIWRRAGVEQAWAAMILPEQYDGITSLQADQRTLLATLAVKKLNRKLDVFAYALEAESVPHLQNAGADKVVLRDAVSPYLLASYAMKPGVPEVLQEILGPGNAHAFDRVDIPRTMVGKPVRELEEWTREKHGGLLIALVSRETVLEMSDILSDDLSSIDAFIKRKFEEAGRNANDLTRKKVRILPPRDQLLTPTDVAIVLRTRTESGERGGKS